MLGRHGVGQELANLIVFALSDRAGFVNGSVLVANNAMDKSWRAALQESGVVAMERFPKPPEAGYPK